MAGVTHDPEKWQPGFSSLALHGATFESLDEAIAGESTFPLPGSVRITQAESDVQRSHNQHLQVLKQQRGCLQCGK